MRLDREEVISFVQGFINDNSGGVDATHGAGAIEKMLLEGRFNDRDMFPLKSHAGAATKVNMFLSDVANDAVRVVGSRFVASVLALCKGRGLFNDQACGILCWVTVCSLEGLDGIGLAGLSWESLKELSNICKGLGVAASPLLHLLTEAHTLEGRGVRPVDWDVEMEKRLRPESVSGMLAKFDSHVLRYAVRSVVAEERGVLRVPEWKDYWERRFSTTKAGAHNRKAGRAMPFGKRELHKRNYVECVEYQPVCAIPPGGTVSVSEKLENGKSRALYALDTENYLRFDAPARALEKCWRNKKAILKPASERSGEQCEMRSQRLMRYKMMFDYADFNSAHTNEAMKIVIEEVFSGMDREWHKWLVDSIDNQWVKDPRDHVPKLMRGTLCSGHRLTTIINTVLNAAYMRIVLGDLYHVIHIEHVGDDVVASTNDGRIAEECVSRVTGSILNMQPDKQGFGEHCAEFLRISYTKGHAVGYFPRSVASAVSGNWVTTARLGIEEYTESVSNLMWTWRQRSQVNASAKLWRSTLVRRLRLTTHEADAWCDGRASVNGSPIWTCCEGAVMHIRIHGSRMRGAVPRRVDGVRLPRRAAADYAARDREYNLLLRLGATRRELDEVMLEASYGNFRSDSADSAARVVTGKAYVHGRYSRELGKFIKGKRSQGPGFLANLLGRRMDESFWVRYARATGCDLRGHGLIDQRVYVCAYHFGTPYADARELQYVLRSFSLYRQMYLALF
jgi:hypothetical protein